MHEHELPSIGADAAIRAMKNGATLTPLGTTFCTAGGTSFTHSLETRRGTVYRVSKRVVAALLTASAPAAQTNLQASA
jgi:hypothetical protein